MSSNPEYQFKKELFCITTLSNLHVGAGGDNYGIIDNLVQRDAATGFPCIHASSLKGAFREYFVKDLKKGANDPFVEHVFGSEKSDQPEEKDGTAENNPDESANKKPEKKTFPGKYRFMQADIISLPVRAYEKTPYLNITCKAAIENIQAIHAPDVIADLDAVAVLSNVHFTSNNGAIKIEPLETSINMYNINPPKEILGDKPAIVTDEVFIEAVSDFGLPVIARNKLNNGQSENLWYEQVLPRQTKLLFYVLVPKNDSNFDEFKKEIQANPIQIGGNGSVGYGICKIQHISLTPKTA